MDSIAQFKTTGNDYTHVINGVRYTIPSQHHRSVMNAIGTYGSIKAKHNGVIRLFFDFPMLFESASACASNRKRLTSFAKSVKSAMNAIILQYVEDADTTALVYKQTPITNPTTNKCECKLTLCYPSIVQSVSFQRIVWSLTLPVITSKLQEITNLTNINDILKNRCSESKFIEYRSDIKLLNRTSPLIKEPIESLIEAIDSSLLTGAHVNTLIDYEELEHNPITQPLIQDIINKNLQQAPHDRSDDEYAVESGSASDDDFDTNSVGSDSGFDDTASEFTDTEDERQSTPRQSHSSSQRLARQEPIRQQPRQEPIRQQPMVPQQLDRNSRQSTSSSSTSASRHQTNRNSRHQQPQQQQDFAFNAAWFQLDKNVIAKYPALQSQPMGVNNQYIVCDDLYKRKINDTNVILHFLFDGYPNIPKQDLITVGIILKNISSDYGATWMALIQNHYGSLFDDPVRSWDTIMTTDGYSEIETLHSFTLKYNHQDYSEYRQDIIHRKLIIAMDSLLSNDIADLFVEKNKFYYVWVPGANGSGGQFYKFSEIKSKWVEEHTDGIIQTLLTEIESILNQGLRREISNMTDTERIGTSLTPTKDINGCLEKMKRVKKIFGEPATKRNIISEISWRVTDGSFLSKLDYNEEIFPFTNGVYDLVSFVFRKTMPSDFVSKTASFAYHPPNFNDRLYVEKRNACERFLVSIMPYKEKREYLLTCNSLSLSGSTRNEKFFICLGTGANGKTKWVYLNEVAFGDLYRVTKSSEITEKAKANSSNATPFLLDKKGVRFSPVNEPDKGEIMNTSTIKQYTSDPVMCRALYGKPVQFKPQLKIWIMANNEIDATTVDMALLRRIDVFYFETKFVDDVPKAKKKYNDKFIMPINYKLNDEIRTWGLQYAHILIEHYKKHVANNYELKTPVSIKRNTERYFNKFNVAADFMNTYFYEQDESTILESDIKDRAGEWNAHFESDKPMHLDLKKLEQHLRNNYKMQRGVVYNWAAKTDIVFGTENDVIEDNDEVDQVDYVREAMNKI
ncbi:D5 DNA Primase [uncultured virus]|nr:D5 DNA Primase [uncultured virus]